MDTIQIHKLWDAITKLRVQAETLSEQFAIIINSASDKKEKPEVKLDDYLIKPKCMG